MHDNGFLTIFQELYIIVKSPLACMVVLQSMWKGPNHCWNFMESGSESTNYTIIKSLKVQKSKSPKV